MHNGGLLNVYRAVYILASRRIVRLRSTFWSRWSRWCWTFVHSKKTPRSTWPGKGSIGVGPIFRVKCNLKFGKLSADLINNGVILTQLWVIFHGKLTRFPNHWWPGIESDPNRPFPGHVWPRRFKSVGAVMAQWSLKQEVPGSNPIIGGCSLGQGILPITNSIWEDRKCHLVVHSHATCLPICQLKSDLQCLFSKGKLYPLITGVPVLHNLFYSVPWHLTYFYISYGPMVLISRFAEDVNSMRLQKQTKNKPL